VKERRDRALSDNLSFRFSVTLLAQIECRLPVFTNWPDFLYHEKLKLGQFVVSCREIGSSGQIGYFRGDLFAF
jgi:hypothetical protein